FTPLVVNFFPSLVIREQLLLVLGKVGVSLLRNEITFVGQAESLAVSVDKFRTGFSMRFIRPRNFGNSFPNQAVRDDELRPAVIVLFRTIERVEKRLHVFLVNFLNVKAVSLKTRAGVFALSCGCRRVERHRVAVVNQNQIIETEVSREST